MPIDLLAAAKTLSTLVGIARAAGTVKSWLSREPDSALTIAVARTVRAFEARLPNVGIQLASFLAADATNDELARLAAQHDAELSRIAQEYVRVTGLFIEPPESAESVATEILHRLLQELDQQLIAGKPEVAIAHHERRDEARHAQVQGYLAEAVAGQQAIQAQLANFASRFEQVAGAFSEPPEERVARFKEQHKTAPLPEARIAWSVFEGSMYGPGWTSRARAEVVLERASVALQLGDIGDATRLFREAFKHDPTHPRAQRNRALGFALEGDAASAIASIEEMCRLDPSNELAATTKTQVLHIAGLDSDVVTFLEPRMATGNATVDAKRVLVASLVRVGRLDDAVAVANALAQEDPVLGTLAVQALAHAARAEHYVHQGVFSAGVTADLERAVSAYGQCIPLARTAGKIGDAVEYMTSRASALMALERSEEAREQAFEAYRLDPDTRQVAITTANIALIGGRPELALTAAQKLASEHDEEAVAIAIAAYSASNRNATYAELVEFARRYTDLAKASHLALEVLIGKAVATTSLDDADELLASWNGPQLKRLLLQARVLVARHDTSGAVKLLLEALSLSPTPPDLFTIARSAHAAGDLEVSLRAFDLLRVTSATPTFILGSYLNVLLERGTVEDEETILTLASTAKAEGRSDVALLHAEAAVRELRQDIAAAKAAWEELAARAPKDARYRLAVARCEYRLGDSAAARVVLDALDRQALDAHELLMAAELDRRVGQAQRAIRTGFAAWKKGRRSADVLFGYATLFVMIPDHDKPWLDAKEVADRTVVTLKFSGEDERSFYVAHSDEDLGLDWLSADSDGRRLIGKRVDDVVEWGTAVGGLKVTATVLRIMTPEVYAANYAFEKAPLMFPGTSPIARLTIGEDAAELKEHLRKANEKIESTLEFAKSRDLPFGTLARLFGHNAVDTWGSLAASGLTIFSNQNTVQELEAESADWRSARGVVVDTLTLLSVGALDSMGRLSARFSRIVVPQRAYDELRECHQRIEEARARGGAKSMHYEDDRLVGSITPPEILANQSEFIRKLLAFCEQKCERVGEPRGYSSFERKELTDVLGAAFVDAVLIAEARSADGVALYSDDAIVRFVAREHYRAMTFSTNAVLHSEQEARDLDDAAHADAMRVLLNLGYRRLTIRVTFLDYLVLGLRPLMDYVAATEELFRKGADRGVTLRLIVTHLRNLVVGAPMWELVLKYLDVLLPKVVAAYGDAAVRFLRKAVPVKDRLIYLPNEEKLDVLLKQWQEATK